MLHRNKIRVTLHVLKYLTARWTISRATTRYEAISLYEATSPYEATNLGSFAPTPATRCGAASNKLYRANLAKGQTGLSIAFDLPTQIGYDSDDPLARGEVGKVGVAISHLGDMRALLDGIPSRP